MQKGILILKILKSVYLMFVVVVFCTTHLIAGETGKISGRVTDKQTGENLLGVNIILIGTTMGAAADEEGRYYIINILPRTYELKASAIGYHSLTIKGIKVRSDLTTEVNIQLESTVIETPTITIVAEQKMVQKDITSTRKTVSRESMDELPGFENTSEIFKLQGGTILGVDPQNLQLTGGVQLQIRDQSVKDIHIRGGRGGEILFLIDGIPVTHPIYGGRSVLDLDVNAVDEVELLTGAFTAEYGQAQSGVVNITTRSGNENFTGGVEYRTDQLKLFGTSYNTDYLTFYMGGPEPFTRYLLPQLGISAPEKLFYFLSLNGSLTNTAYNNHRIRDDISFFGFNIKERQDNIFNITGKLSWEITPSFRAVLSYIGSFKDWSDFDWLWLYNPNNLPSYSRDNNNISVTFNHVLSPSTYYSINIGYLGVDLQGSLFGKNPSDYWRFYKNGQEYSYSQWKKFSNNYSFIPDSFKTEIKPPQIDPLTGFFDSQGYNSIWRDDNTKT
ncbi:MAG: carboxypeptidase-like regulatory domain-containing protein, partial [Ignavibacteria bacterium]|nr:carboxypeptidase-like regulatory domain-containing protein [Ignavibacteria bacterium]